MDSYIVITQLPTIYELYQSKKKELEDIIENLTKVQVEKDKAFNKTTESIYNQILLKPVQFKEPKINGHHSITKKRSEAERMFYGDWRGYNVEIEFPFEGSYELFSYAPNGATHSSNSMRVFQPNGSYFVLISIDALDLERNKVLQEAKNKMECTFNLITTANAQAETWSNAMKIQINAALIEQRKKLLAFYS